MVSSTAVIAALTWTSFISLAPNLILLVFPEYGEDPSRGSVFLSMGQALAAGGLLGDVFLHTLSHAADYEREQIGIWALCGFTVFLIMDVLIRSLEGDHHHTHTAENGHHPHTAKTEKAMNGEKQEDSTCSKSLLLSSSVLLNLTGDSLHNFTDGLAIGASFAVGSLRGEEDVLSLTSLLASRGGLAALSILFHEIPHELGDYCILVKNGFSKYQAILAQFLSATAAFVGTLFGLWAVEGWGGEALIFFTAGGFLYLAAVNILPQILDEPATLRLRFVQLAAFVAGIAFMYAVAMLEEHDEGHDHHHHHHHLDEAAIQEHHHHHHHGGHVGHNHRHHEQPHVPEL